MNAYSVQSEVQRMTRFLAARRDEFMGTGNSAGVQATEEAVSLLNLQALVDL
jgi:hypothetical protein